MPNINFLLNYLNLGEKIKLEPFVLQTQEHINTTGTCTGRVSGGKYILFVLEIKHQNLQFECMFLFCVSLYNNEQDNGLFALRNYYT